MSSQLGGDVLPIPGGVVCRPHSRELQRKCKGEVSRVVAFLS